MLKQSICIKNRTNITLMTCRTKLQKPLGSLMDTIQGEMMPIWLSAGLWGWLSGSALLLGALVGYYVRVPSRVIAAIMAFGSGVLISALSFELMQVAFERGGIDATSIGFLSGAIVYTFANRWLAHKGAKHRKRSGEQQPSEQQDAGSGAAIAIGALLDGIPESIVIGLSMLEGGAVSVVAVVAIFLSNVPEGLASASGMKKAQRKPRYIFVVWGGIAFISGAAAMLGYSVFQHFSAAVISATTAIAAGAILAMICDTMIPEAFSQTHDWTGLIAVVGFLTAFMLSMLG